MGSPENPITLTVDQIEEMNRKLTDMRHNVNNYLSLITATAEIATRKPDAVPKMMSHLIEQPAKINQEIRKFSHEFERTLGLTVNLGQG